MYNCGAAIHEARVKRHLSTSMMTRKLGIVQLFNFELGQRGMTREKYEELCDFLDLDVETSLKSGSIKEKPSIWSNMKRGFVYGMNGVAQEVKRTRLESGFNLKQICDATGIKGEKVRALEDERYGMKRDNFIRLCDLFGLDSDDLVRRGTPEHLHHTLGDWSPNWEGEVEVIGSTDKSLCVRHGGHDAYIPRSGIHKDSEILCDHPVGSVGKLIVPLWLAEERGIGDERG